MQTIARVSQTDVVVEQIRSFLLSDAIQEGEKLPTEKDLCERLGVGRSTVREAIRTLQVMGYVRLYPGRGAFLTRKNLDDATPTIVSWLSNHKMQIEDIVEVRIGLETMAAKLAAERGGEEDFQELDRIRSEFEEALMREEYERLGYLDEEFHQAMVEATGNAFLIAVNKLVSQSFLEFRKNSFRIKEHAANAVIPHRDILSSLRKRDVEIAQVYVRRHLEKILVDRDKTVRRREGE